MQIPVNFFVLLEPLVTINATQKTLATPELQSQEPFTQGTLQSET